MKNLIQLADRLEAQADRALALGDERQADRLRDRVRELRTQATNNGSQTMKR